MSSHVSMLALPNTRIASSFRIGKARNSPGGINHPGAATAQDGQMPIMRAVDATALCEGSCSTSATSKAL